MSRKNIAVLNDEDLTEVCGGLSEKATKQFASEAGRQCIILVAAPLVISASIGISTIVSWGVEKLTKKLDQKLDGK